MKNSCWLPIAILLLILLLLIFINPMEAKRYKLSQMELSLKFKPPKECTNISLVNSIQIITPISNEIKRAKNYTVKDLYWLAKIVHAEAEGECDEGQIAVANVVLNRVNDNRFPNTIKEVIFQKVNGVAQFSPTIDGRINLLPDERAIENAKKALEGKVVVPDSVLFFYAPDASSENNWIITRRVFTKIGNHVFTYVTTKE
jgi:N-acetylmuramoyl-L-alanine amidase